MTVALDRVRLSDDAGRLLVDALKRGEIGAFKAESDAAACLLPLLEAIGWRGGTREIVEALPHSANTLEWHDLINVLATLGYKTVRRRVGRGGAVDGRLFPCLYVDRAGRPAVLLDHGADGRVRAYSGRERRIVDLREDWLEGDLFLLADRGRTSRLLDGQRRNWIVGVFRRFDRYVLRLLLFTFLLNLAALSVPIFILGVYDLVIPSGSLDVLPMFAIGVGAVVVLELTIRLIRAAMIAHVGARLEYLISTSVMEQILSLPASVVESSAIGNQISRLREFDGIRELFTGVLVTIFLELPFVVMMLAVVVVLGGWLAVIPFAMVLVFLVIGLVSVPALRRRVERASRARYERHAFLVEMLTQLRTIREAGAEATWLDRFRELNADANLAQFSSAQLNQLLQSLAHALMMIAGLATVGFGVLAVLEDAVTIGALIATMTVVWRILSPINGLLLTLARAEQIRGAVAQLNTLMRSPRETGDDGGSSVERRWSGSIGFERVSFRYSPNADPALLGVDLSVAPGEIVAIMGANGSGKTSILRLILGLYRPQAGQIKIDGLGIRQIAPRELRRLIAYVPQQGHLIHGTLEQNLRLANPTATHEELRATVEAIGLDTDIDALPDGFDTRIADQTVWRLNTGFRQRMSIARALLRDAPIVLLDEPAQALDEDGDRALLELLPRLREGRAVLMVSHRPSHVRLADKVLVLHQGQVVRSGTPDEVLGPLGAARP